MANQANEFQQVAQNMRRTTSATLNSLSNLSHIYKPKKPVLLFKDPDVSARNGKP